MKKSLIRIVVLAAVLCSADIRPRRRCGNLDRAGSPTRTAPPRQTWLSNAECATKCVKDKGAKWALVNSADKSVWVLSNQDARRQDGPARKSPSRARPTRKRRRSTCPRWSPSARCSRPLRDPGRPRDAGAFFCARPAPNAAGDPAAISVRIVGARARVLNDRRSHERQSFPQPDATRGVPPRRGRAPLGEGLARAAPPADAGRPARGPEGASPQEPRPALRDRRAAVRPAGRRVARVLEVPAALDLDPVGDRRRLDGLQLHGAPPRRRAPRRLERSAAARRARSRHPLRGPVGDLGAAVHPLAPDAPRGARRRRGRSEAPLPLAEDQPALVQAALLHARALSHLLPRGPQGDGELSAGAPEADRTGAARDRSPSTSRSWRRCSGRAASPSSRASTSCPISSSSRSPSP